MGNKELCANCCAVYSVLGVVLLLFFGAMFQRGAMTFQVTAAKHGWDMQEKATACYTAAILYGVTLFISVMAKMYFGKMAARTGSS